MKAMLWNFYLMFKQRKSVKNYGLLFCLLNLNSIKETNKIKRQPKQLPIKPNAMEANPSS